ncbi:IS3 family transposase [Paenibacillus sp. IHBB 10380]|uniref:IS3 family transposase n=1 Tax=Paenibacillus sp. IHBB 10380 TaxID=1566358 RepID=UPI001186B9DE
MFGNLETGGITQKYNIIREAAEQYSITGLCKLFSVSRSGYYAYAKRQVQDQNAEDKVLIRQVYKRYDRIYGYRQIQLFLLQDHGVWMNHKKVYRLMQIIGIRSQIRRKHRCNYISSVGRWAGLSKCIEARFPCRTSQSKVGNRCDPVPCRRYLAVSLSD